MVVKKTHIANKEEWYIAHEGEVVHYGILQEGSHVSTGLENLDIYDTQEEWEEILLNNFGITIEIEL